MSGLSAGGYMAVQMHIAHSASVKGAAALAAGPYFCAQGSVWTAYYNCMSPGAWTPLPPTAFLVAEAKSYASAGSIDPLSNLAGAKVWLFSGTQDRTVYPAVVSALRDLYSALGAKPLLVADKPAGHGMAVEEASNACGATKAPFINDCDYDSAGELLAHLLGKLAPPGSGGRLVAFDQKRFDAPGLADEGWVYVPKACGTQSCRVHVAFHGCRQRAEEFARGAGYNRWAETNRLVVLYPQVRSSWAPFNPNGCWDWWGYTGAQYATKEGGQIRAVKAMLERLSAPR